MSTVLAGLVFSSCVIAEVPVVDLSESSSSNTVTAVTPQSAPAAPSKAMQRYTADTAVGGSTSSQLSEVFDQLQILRQEVQDLRGVVEQQSNELQQLKQQRKDDYIDLDRRFSELQKSAIAVPPQAGSTLTSAMPAAGGSDKADYENAYNLVKLRKPEEAAAAFHNFISAYPASDLTPNAYYWLGEIYLAQNQLDQAEEQFSTLLKNYPEHRKVPDAKFKLGKVYLQQGKKADAKKLIQDVAQGDSEVAPVAKAFLQSNF